MFTREVPYVKLGGTCCIRSCYLLVNCMLFDACKIEPNNCCYLILKYIIKV